MKSVVTGIAVTALTLAAGAAMAQSTSQGSTPQQSGGMQHMGKTMHHMDSSNASSHSMPATVTSVDQKTGMVEVNSAGMGLKLHFPPASLANVKAGDKITLRMGFSKS